MPGGEIILTFLAPLIAILAMTSGVLLLILGPRLVHRVSGSTEQVVVAKSLLMRLMHLFFLESIALVLLYYSMCIFGVITPLPFLSAVGSVIGLALVITCLLCQYL